MAQQSFTVSVVAARGSEHALAWLSLQYGGVAAPKRDGISVVLADTAFISPRFRARQDLWNVDNRVTVQYLIPHSPHALHPVLHPHLTFHPPMSFHVRANKDPEMLFEGIADVGLMLVDDTRVPWIRFVSKPVRELMPTKARARATVISVPVESADVSVGLAVNFVRPGANDSSGGLVDRFLDWGQYRLHVFCEALHAQQPTLAWFHEC
jgi:hypothetical protein